MRKGIFAFCAMMFLFAGICSCGTNTSLQVLSVVARGIGGGTITSNVGGISCSKSQGLTSNTCTASLDSGASVTLTATPSSGYVFSAWSGGGCSGTGTCQVTLNSALTVNATFVMILYSSSAALNGSDAANTNNTSNIWVMRTDGTGQSALTQMTAASADSSVPQWSPDGSQIVFASAKALNGSDAANTNNTSNIWVMNADGTSQTALTQMTAASAGSFVPQWSPDGSQIVFRSTRALNGSDAANTNNTSNIWVMSASGGSQTALTQITAANAGSFVPQWSPDASQIIFDSSRALNGSDAANTNNTSNIWVMSASGGSQTALTQSTAASADSFFPQWSPDASQIIFDSSRALNGSDAANATSNIWVMNANGTSQTALTQITTGAAGSSIPQWSPDASQIVCNSTRALDGSDASNTNATSNIWVMNANGTGQTALTQVTAASAGSHIPQWSPDGSQIVFRSAKALNGSDASNTNATTNIWVMTSSGGSQVALTQMTAASANSSNPQW